jgi:hypothetical protein
MTPASTASRHAGADHGVDVEATPVRTYDEVRATNVTAANISDPHAFVVQCEA